MRKKLLFGAAIALVVGIMFSSCVKSEGVANTNFSSDPSYVDLAQSIAEFDASFPSLSNNEVDDSVRLTNPGKIKKSSRKNVKGPKPLSSRITGSKVGWICAKAFIKAIKKYDKEKLDLSTLSKEQFEERLYKDVFEGIKKYMGKDFPDIDLATFIQMVKASKRNNKETENLNEDEMIEHIRNIKEGKKEDMTLVADYINKLRSIPDMKARRKYAAGYVKLINESQIPAESKQQILDVTSILASGLNMPGEIRKEE